MSDSENRNGHKGFSKNGNMKKWRRKVNKRFRKKTKEAIRDGNEVPKDLNEVSNQYDAPQDKFYFGDDPDFEHLKRK